MPEHVINGCYKEDVASRVFHSPFLKITLCFENSSYSSHASADFRLILKVVVLTCWVGAGEGLDFTVCVFALYILLGKGQLVPILHLKEKIS